MCAGALKEIARSTAPEKSRYTSVVVFGVTIFQPTVRRTRHGPILERPQMFRVVLLVLFIFAPALAHDNGQCSQVCCDAPGGGV